MTAEFLYRINYGPISIRDKCLVRNFLIDQYIALEDRRRFRTMSSICGWSWKSILPGSRAPIRRHYSRNQWRRTKGTPVMVLLCFLEPVLVSKLGRCIYPDCIAEYYAPCPFVHARSRRIFEIEFRLNLINTLGTISTIPLVPNAALVWRTVVKACALSVSSDHDTVIPREIFDQPDSDSSVSILNNVDSKDRSQIIPYETGCLVPMSTLNVALFEIMSVVPGPLNLSAFRDEPEGLKFRKDTIFDIDRTMDRRARLIQKASLLKLHLSHIDAAFICSGPFRLMFTLDLDEHLVLGNDGFLRVYWDFEPSPGDRLLLYEDHFLWDDK